MFTAARKPVSQSDLFPSQQEYLLRAQGGRKLPSSPDGSFLIDLWAGTITNIGGNIYAEDTMSQRGLFCRQHNYPDGGRQSATFGRVVVDVVRW